MSQGFSTKKPVIAGSGIAKIFVNGVKQTLSSGTEAFITGIPSGVKHVKLVFEDFGFNGTDRLAVQIGPASGYEATGYDGTASRHGTGVASVIDTTFFGIYLAASTESFTGTMDLVLIDEANNTWVSSHKGGSAQSTAISFSGGSAKSISGELGEIRIARTFTSSFQQGSVNIQYDNPKPQVNTSESGLVVQVVNVANGEYTTGTTTIPNDNTIPTSTEGTEFMTASITPRNSANKLKIEVVVNGANSNAGSNLIAALFQDAGAAAIAAAWGAKHAVAHAEGQVKFTHWMTAGTAASTTFKVRAGSGTAGTFYFNGSNGTRRFGGVMASSITITEYSA